MRSLAQSKHRSAHTSIVLRSCVSSIRSISHSAVNQSDRIDGHWTRHISQGKHVKKALALCLPAERSTSFRFVLSLWKTGAHASTVRSTPLDSQLKEYSGPQAFACSSKAPVAAHNRFYSCDVAFTVRNIHTKMPPGSPYFAGHNTDLNENSRILC